MKTIEKEISGYVTSQPDIVVAYLFGSEAAGKAHSGSDVDVALLFAEGKAPSVDDLLNIQDDMTSQLKREIDIVVLNEAPPVIRMQVLRKGKLILKRDHSAYIDFFVRTIKEYDDLKMVRSVIEKKILRGKIYG